MIVFVPRGNQIEKFEDNMNVICTNAVDGNEEIVGKRGVVINSKFKRPLILFNEDIDGHDGFTKNKKLKSKCWMVNNKCLLVVAHEDIDGNRFWSVEKGKYISNEELNKDENLQKEAEMAKNKRGLYRLILFDPKTQKVIEKQTVAADDESGVLFEAGITKDFLKEKGINKLRDVDVLIREEGQVRSDLTEVPVKVIMQAGKTTVIKEEQED